MNLDPHASPNPSISVDVVTDGGGSLTLRIEGRLDAVTTAGVWRRATSVLAKTPPPHLVVDASGIEYCDVSGIGLLVELHRRQQHTGGQLEIQGLRPEFHELLDLFSPAEFAEFPERESKRRVFFEEIAWQVVKAAEDCRSFVAFIGELSLALVHALLQPRRVRWKDSLRVAETAGVNALPIIALVSFLVGLIMAFQATIPMRQFGAEIFVADLVALSMLRELGPLMTAIVLVGRSGSAFAAELGTMKVNEEIDALNTMGLDPVRFLVVPRVIAALVTTPLLTVFSGVIGILGGAVVLVSLGYPLVTYFNQVLSAANYVDFLGGVLKAFVFSIMIAGIGCLRGLQTHIGATAVGESTTRAVVTGIVLIVVIDGVFSVLYYQLGI